MNRLPSVIHIYCDAVNSSLNVRLLARYLGEMTGLDADLRGSLVLPGKSLAEEFARAKIIDPAREEQNLNPLPAEIEYESRLLSTQKPSGLFYDGFCLQEIFRQLIPRQEHNLKHLHLIFTSRLFGTFEDNRYHARAAVFGFPSLISTTGVVEAPAKPREFYLKRQFGQDRAVLKEELKGRFIDYHDPRLTEVMKGYLMQALFYHLTGDPFCEDKGCRLYNAHWQEELIFAQLGAGYEFCNHHQEILDQINGTQIDRINADHF